MTETPQVDVGENPDLRTYQEGGPRIFLALAAVQQELPRIRKDQTADAGQYSYSYADLAAVSAQLLPLLGKNGLAFSAWPRVIDGKLVLRYYLLHESGESMSGDYPLKGGSAQQLGSEITYARRYCLCAVTGVAPDDDDDAAAADGVRQAEQAEQQAEIDQEMRLAVDKVRGAWATQYGEFNPEQASEVFKVWSRGGSLKHAPAGQLSAFAGYLLSLPAEDAGSTPNTDPTRETEHTGRYRDPDAPLSADQRTRIIASLNELGIRERQDRLQWMTSTLGRTVKSTNDLTMAEAGRLIDTLNGGVTVLEDGNTAGDS